MAATTSGSPLVDSPMAPDTDFVWCHSKPPGTDGARPDLSEGTVKGGLYAQRLNHLAIEPGTRTGKLGSGSTAVETHNPGDGYTTVAVTATDKIGIIARVCACMTNSGLSIVAATVCTDKKNIIATEKFKVVTLDGGKEIPEDEHDTLQSAIIAVLDSDDVNHEKTSISGVVISCEMEDGEESTLCKLICKSRPGLVRDIASVLVDLHVNIESLELQSDNETSEYVLELCDSGGNKLTQMVSNMVSTVLTTGVNVKHA
mmetsp:Transcript_31021/g.99044  ORF Transcript_31021/g.99044 Transcript_31021/m.99044 type:complete len:258 (+) Transcript_31021:178-951(+)|eukprot:CAMPEP_0182913940 /NCGR_PEP_ID=MMETSP0034_2-20130328/38295_1 /TAXON_ID=156128 /ORGANISM="Nephroselmis pyriformis, Strain CCMP717" /LENGTH=257 /DNA_ID=CAMNT_0025050669 /DNA_START=84 /DNA_END=857 /DNA_ORIENTATION=-